MKKIFKNRTIPEGSVISKGFEKFDYYDSFMVSITSNESIDVLLNKGFTVPQFAIFLMKIRNSIVKVFGLKTGDGKEKVLDYYPVGKRAKYFTVVDRNENEIVMQENVKHLNFRTSLLKSRNETGTHVFLTTIVKYNNIFGRIYFAPVQLFHRMIMKALMKNLLTK